MPIGFQSAVHIVNDAPIPDVPGSPVGDAIQVFTNCRGCPDVSLGVHLIGNTNPLGAPSVPVPDPGSLSGWDPTLSTPPSNYSRETADGLSTQTFSGPLDFVPEPGTMIPVGAGLAGLALRRRAPANHRPL